MPTFAELGQARLPKDITLDGKSFAPLLLGKSNDSDRDWIMSLGHGGGRLDNDGVRGTHDFADRVLRDKRYKVWLHHNPTINALYDLYEDPLEQNNLINSKRTEHLTALNRFRSIIEKQPKSDGRPLYRPRQANPWDKTLQSQKEETKKIKIKRERRKKRKTSLK